jgi:hypothetical protein
VRRAKSPLKKGDLEEASGSDDTGHSGNTSDSDDVRFAKRILAAELKTLSA